MRLRAAVIVVAVFVLYGSLHSDERTSPKHNKMGFEVFPVNKTVWHNGPPSLPKGAQIAVLEGDPNKEGPFVFRVKVPDGYRIPPPRTPSGSE
jgi:hypothetical protein